MDETWLAIYLVFAVPAVTLGVLYTLVTLETHRFARNRCRKRPPSGSVGRVRVVVPCKGVDVALEKNLARLCEQDYSDFELVFVVESEQDPACDAIGRAMRLHPHVATRMIVAGTADDCGQKVHNLRAATAELPPSIQYLAFVDSDAQPDRMWLRSLISQLDRPGVGAVTGYRWFVPQRLSLGNLILYVINSSLSGLMGPGKHYYAWGGSWSIRRAVFDETQMRAAWRGTLSDDLVATNVLNAAGLKVIYEPRCLVASPLDVDVSQAMEFLRRQYLIGRFYARPWWRWTVTLVSLGNVAVWGGIAAMALRLAPQWDGIFATVVATWWGCASLRAIIRQDTRRMNLPQLDGELRWAARFDMVFNPLVATVNWVGLIASMCGSTIKWRGYRYQLYHGGLMQRLDAPTGDQSTIKFPESAGARLPGNQRKAS